MYRLPRRWVRETAEDSLLIERFGNDDHEYQRFGNPIAHQNTQLARCFEPALRALHDMRN